MELSLEQIDQRAAFRAFVDTHIVPVADQNDREQNMPRDLIRAMANAGYLGAYLPAAFGGQGMDLITFGLLCEELGRGCSSARNLVTVQTMVGQAIYRWGDEEQRTLWLQHIASGDVICAFALTEPRIGSDARHIEATAVPAGDEYAISGHKKWITYGQIADLFLVFAQEEGHPCAFLVEKDRPGLRVDPRMDMLGSRASMLADVFLEDCRVPRANMVGHTGFGFMPVALFALNLGRLTVAWGCTGLAQACLDLAVSYANEREQFGKPLKEHQLIKQMITDTAVNVKAARLLCYEASRAQEAGHTEAVTDIMMAKYFASTAARKAADDAVQIQGAVGVSADSPAQRYLRDAKIMEIIEGSTQIHQIKIADYVARSRASSRVK